MKKLFYTLCLAAAIPSYAMAYQPFIVEGRVWEYVHVVNANSCLTTVCKTFDGKVDFDGRRYSKFVTFRKSDYPNDRLSGTVVDASESIDRKECYLREKDEQVFILVDEYGETVYDMDFASGDTSGIREALIMNFSLANGEAFPSDCFHNTEYAKEGLFKTELDPVVYFDRSYGKYGICDAGGNEFSPRYAEALGGLNNGIFPDNTLYVAPNMTSEYLLTVTEPDGGTIYRSPSYEWLLHPDFSGSVRTVREDRVWEYLYTENGLLDNPVVENGGDNYLLFRMRFDGTCEIDGVEYHRLRYTGNVVKWAFSYEGDLFGYEETTNDNPQEYLMREEDGKVYVFNNFNSPEIEGDIEILDYDFNLREGDSYRLEYCIPFWKKEPIWAPGIEDRSSIFTVTEVDKTEIDGQDCLVQKLYKSESSPASDAEYTVIEGVGFCRSGFLPLFVYDTRVCTDAMNYTLNRVYNAEGDIIYRGLDIDPATVSVDRVTAQPSPAIEYDDMTLTATGNDGSSLTLTLFEVSGKEISEISGTGSVSASTAALSPGVYVAVADADGSTVARRKFVVR